MIRFVSFAVLAACAASKPAAPARGSAPSPARTTTGPAQPASSGEVSCPAIQLKAPDSVSQGTKARVIANLIDGPARPTFSWSASAGRVASKEGNPPGSIVLVDTAGLAGSSVTVTLELTGLPSQCASTNASATFLVGP